MSTFPAQKPAPFREQALKSIHPDALPQDEGMQTELKAIMRIKAMDYRAQQAIKRTVDIIGSLFGLMLLSPMFLVIALLIKLTSPGPIFYKSKRIGQHNQPFGMYKFRTMIVGADKLRDKLRAEAKQEGELFKIENDTRITKIGQVLRKYSLDEFPQLFNVLKGEMSLVGPRPFSPDNCQLFHPPYTVRFAVTPGMTGKWQISGRSNLSFQQACELDISYVIDWTILEDLKILFMTVPVVLLKKGAY